VNNANLTAVLSAERAQQAFLARTPGSRVLHERGANVMPRGVSGAAKYYSPYPVFLASADGDSVTDVDGKRYIDLLMGAGPMLLGHGHPRVVDAIREQAGRMTSVMSPHDGSIRFAERLRGHMPYLELMRFTNTGSEATRTAIRIARAATGRTLIVKCEGGFHGSDDAFLVSAHSALLSGTDQRPEPVLDYAGLPERLLDETVLIPYNDPQSATTILDELGDRVAAVIIEPVAFSSGGGIPGTPEFARALREATERHGSILIFDEVLCALRMGLAGAPAYLGVDPDLSTIGKAIGGGLPLGAIGGRAALLEATLGVDAGDRQIFQSGTFTENPLSIAAGTAALDVLESEPVLERANAAGERIRCGLREAFASSDTPATITGTRSIFQVHIGATSVENRRDVLGSDMASTRAFLLAMVTQGVLWPPIHPALTSGAHSEESADHVVAGARAVLERLSA
jgi:glutamate-1-semialdehyde 2,1-aminomutase